ncbi:amidohydrolase [Gottschalkia purinilytica]|uniref:Amidohydrolase n=1 Tax=Gottschalkia purinilytica TaxID=1503 RepID=A0A0L0WF19_GOTPU|nr:M20 family metallopeptidase [Gottschalkia purinilytica]KNF10015.1 amidohydrolase [Gottschalkia purinilytica]
MFELIDSIKNEVVDMRKYLHQIPELGFQEVKTSKYIKERLESLGFELEVVAGTGIVAFKKGTSSEKAIAFRSDIDGLRVKEETGLPFASKEENHMHACGHDGHMSILLGFATFIASLPSIKRDIVLIFQPAEEGPGGAEVIVKEGILKKYNVESIFGLHILPDIEEGKIGINYGPIMAQCGEIEILIEGKGGHGAMPHTSIDTIYVTSQLISSYQSIVSRNIEPIEGAVLTIGKINGGEAKNVIAEEVKIEGTIRAYRPEVYNTIKSRIQEINSGIEKMFGVKITTNVIDMYPAVNNDYDLFNIMKEALDEDEIHILKPMMIAEDFSYYQQEIPGFFFMLGSRNEKLNYIYPLHHCKFNFSDEVLGHGVKTYIKIANKLGII